MSSANFKNSKRQKLFNKTANAPSSELQAFNPIDDTATVIVQFKNRQEEIVVSQRSIFLFIPGTSN